MCGIISQQQYRQEYPEQVIGTFTKEGAEPTMLIQDRSGDVSLILSTDGTDYKDFWTNGHGTWLTPLKQLSEAYKYLEKKGYTIQPVEQETPAPTHAHTPGIAELATTYNQQPVEDMAIPEGQDIDRLSDTIVVQGRTLRQWNEQGEANEKLPPVERVHPQKPEGREPTMAEVAALINSMTTYESLGALLVLDGSSTEEAVASIEALATIALLAGVSA